MDEVEAKNVTMASSTVTRNGMSKLTFAVSAFDRSSTPLLLFRG